MARQANGNYIQPANTAAVTATTISSTAYNTLITDIGTEITNSVDRGGRSAMTAPLPMGANKITGMADPTVSTDGATKNYVDTATGSFFSTGDVKITIKTTPDSGWLMFDDGTFGSASSGSSNSNNVANLALFTLMFNNMSDAAAPLLTAGGGATTRAGQTNAATAWAANCRMTLPKTLGRALGIAGAGSGLTSRALGAVVGEETHQLVLGEIPTGITSGAAGLSVADSSSLNIPHTTGSVTPGTATGGGQSVGQSSSGAWGNASFTVSGQTTSNNTGGAAHNNMQPTVFFNAMIKI